MAYKITQADQTHIDPQIQITQFGIQSAVTFITEEDV